MIVNYSADVSSLDQPPLEAAQERPGKPIRIRVPLLVFRLHPSPARPGLGAYRTWNNVSWILECESVGEAIAVRDTLQQVFSLIRSHGIERVRHCLTSMPQTQ
mgnify:CR=1 FL=1